MAKLQAGEADATFLAAAGLDRLGEAGVGVRLDPESWLPAPAQAAIGIECRADDARARDLLSAIDHAPSREEVLAERALLEGLGGTCHSPIAALTRRDGEHLHMTAAIYSPDGAICIKRDILFAPGDLAAARVLAADLLAEAPDHVRAHFGSAS